MQAYRLRSRSSRTANDSEYAPLDGITGQADDTTTALPPYRVDRDNVARPDPEQPSKSNALVAKSVTKMT